MVPFEREPVEVEPHTQRGGVHKFPASVHWAAAVLAATLAFLAGGTLVGFPYRDDGGGVFGVRNWLLATMLAGVVGTMIGPPAHRRTARWIFIGIPISVSILVLLGSFADPTTEAISVSAVIQSMAGGLLAWGFLSRIIISFRTK